jgi:hypothetical protein
MRNQAIRGLLAAALCAALVTAARAAATDDDETPPPKQAAPSGIGAWWNNMFGDKPKPPEKTEKKKVERPVKPSVRTAAQQEVLMRREREANLRRLAVCGRLKEIAAQQNDDDMLRRIEKLEDDINQLYEQRTLGLQQGVDDEPKPQDKPKPYAARASTRNRDTMEDDQ